MEETLLAIAFAEDLSYQIYYSLGRTTMIAPLSKIARSRTTITSPYDTSIGKAVLYVINAHKTIGDCYHELISHNVKDHELVGEYMIEAAPVYFESGYRHESLIAYCSTVIGVCGLYIEIGHVEFYEVGINVISTLLLGFFINGEFQANGAFNGLIDFCLLFNGCEARRRNFIQQLHESHPETDSKKKSDHEESETTDCVPEESSSDHILVTDFNQPSTSTAIKNLWEGSTIVECELNAKVTDENALDADKPDAGNVSTTGKSGAKRKKKKGKSGSEKARFVTESTAGVKESENKTSKASGLESREKRKEDISKRRDFEYRNEKLNVNAPNELCSNEQNDNSKSNDCTPIISKARQSDFVRSAGNDGCASLADNSEKTVGKRKKRKGKSSSENK